MDGYSGRPISPSFHHLPNNSAIECLYTEAQDEEDCHLSDCESGISGAGDDQQEEPQFPDHGLMGIAKEDKMYEIINKMLVPSFRSYGFSAELEAIHRNTYSSIMSRARHLSFGIYANAMRTKCDGDANVKYAWYGASKQEIDKILVHGFGLPKTAGIHGYGVYLSHADHPTESMTSLLAGEEDGLKYALLCRVILGRMEVIPFGSGQYNPSSTEFDSGVDNLDSPRRYIIWSSSMNTRILPEFMVSFRTSPIDRGCQWISQPLKLPNSDWMPFTTLIRELSKLLPPDAIKLIVKHHSDHQKLKITRREMIQRVRRVAGDKLLIMVIRSYREKILIVA